MTDEKTKIEVILFKPNGRFYTHKTVKIPQNLEDERIITENVKKQLPLAFHAYFMIPEFKLTIDGISYNCGGYPRLILAGDENQ